MTAEREALALPLAGYPVPETVATREHSLHCFACGGALSHSCRCERVTLHRDAVASLIYWVQTDTLEAARAALANSATIRDTDEDAERDLSAARCLRSYAEKYAVLHRDIADDFIRGAEALEQRANRLASTPAEPREASGYCPFCMTADPVAPAEGDAEGGEA